MSYTLREHTADIAVEATATDCSGLFSAIADGLAAAMCDSIPDSGGDRFAIECRAEGREALLYEFLDQLIYERDVRLVLPVDTEATVREPTASRADAADDSVSDDSVGDNSVWTVTASARGIPLGDVTAREIKAVTYSEMVVEPRAGGWYGYVVFDV